MVSEDHTNEIDLVVRFADEKGGGEDGQLIIDDVDLESSGDNRIRHGIGNQEPQAIEQGNNEYTFNTTCFMNRSAARALKRIDDGEATAKAVYVRDDGNWVGRSESMVPNGVTLSSSDGGDTTVEVSADLFGIDWDLE